MLVTNCAAVISGTPHPPPHPIPNLHSSHAFCPLHGNAFVRRRLICLPGAFYCQLVDLYLAFFFFEEFFFNILLFYLKLLMLKLSSNQQTEVAKQFWIAHLTLLESYLRNTCLIESAKLHWNHNIKLSFWSFSIFVFFVFFWIFDFLSLRLEITPIKYLKGLNSQKSLLVSKF